MAEADATALTREPGGAEAAAELQASAEGWHRLQLAVIGFIGLCGVLTGTDASQPMWLQVAAGGLALGSLALACLATYLVGTVAWPLRAGRMPAAAPGRDPLQAGAGRLKRGILLTFVAVAALALGTATSWWPQTEEQARSEQAALLSVSVTGGRTFCGAPAQGRARTLALVTAGDRIEIPLGAVTAVAPAESC